MQEKQRIGFVKIGFMAKHAVFNMIRTWNISMAEREIPRLGFETKISPFN
jgi:hypothetical protein